MSAGRHALDSPLRPRLIAEVASASAHDEPEHASSPKSPRLRRTTGLNAPRGGCVKRRACWRGALIAAAATGC
jgi:hypothetical protein